MKAVKVSVIILVLCCVGVFVAERFGLPLASTSHALSGSRVSGIVVANDVIVSAKVDGRIEKLAVEEGSVVSKGDLIAVIALEEAEAEKLDQQAAINQLKVKLERSSENVNLERERNSGQVTRSSAQLASAESEVRQAQQELEQLRRDSERAQQLWNEKVLAKQDAERSRNAVEVAEARLRALQDRMLAARADVELTRANERQISLAMRDVDQIQQELSQARARMSRLITRIGYAQVHAPIGGVVSVRASAEGEIVNVGTPIVTIVDLDDVWVKASFEETYASDITLGQDLPVELASGKEMRAKVIYIAPESDFATQRDFSRIKRDIRTFSIKARVQNPERRVHPGMTAYIYLPQRRLAQPGTEKAPGAATGLPSADR